MTYKETIGYLYARLPMFTRIGEAAYKPSLDNTLHLLNALGNPHHELKCIHIAGTNGKGSTANMLAAILQSEGYKTGLYTSPHLLDFRERIRINGKMISKNYVRAFVDRYRSLFDTIQPSFFEMSVALCFEYFAQKKTEIAVIETGLGGRLDSTNVITPYLSIITNIGLDHTHILGNTLGAIAVEKAGIIKSGVPVIIGETQNETKKIFLDKANQEHSEISFADRNIKIKPLSHSDKKLKIEIKANGKLWFDKLNVSLTGEYQVKNIATTLQGVLMIRRNFHINDKAIIRGLGKVQDLTGFAGRWHVVNKFPKVVLDTGHNAHGLKLSMKQLISGNSGRLHIVFGVMKDKKMDNIIPLLPKKALYFLCSPDIPRALPVKELKEIFNEHQLNNQSFTSIRKAYRSALDKANKHDSVFVGGSTFVVAEVLEYLQKNKKRKSLTRI